MKNLILMLWLHEILSISAKYSTIKPTAYLGQDLETDQDHDVVIYISDANENQNSTIDKQIFKALHDFKRVNPKVLEETTIVPFPEHKTYRLIYSPVGNLKAATADARLITSAAENGMEKAIGYGFRRPLLILGVNALFTPETKWTNDPLLTLNAILGAYQALYVPIEVREAFPDRASPIDKFGVRVKDDSLLKIAWALEEGRRVARDIAGSDPERMTPMKISDYLETEFSQHLQIETSSEKVDGKKYPLIEAVNRAAEQTPRHSGRVIKMEYYNNVDNNTSSPDLDLYLIGKGTTFDTGGLDLKTNKALIGKHREKSGAAAVAGFMKMLALLEPNGLNVHAKMAFVRNSIGADSYTPDDIVTASSGKRVRVTDTDAEGRMVMADLLWEAKEEAMTKSNPYLFTWGTLSDQARKSYGDSFAAVMDNGVARRYAISQSLQTAGDLIADLAEVCTLRSDDFKAHKGMSEYEDLVQSPKTTSHRGHLTPAAFLMMASGLDNHDIEAESKRNKSIPFTHLDLSASVGKMDQVPTGSPSLMFASKYILPKVMSNYKF